MSRNFIRTSLFAFVALAATSSLHAQAERLSVTGAKVGIWNIIGKVTVTPAASGRAVNVNVTRRGRDASKLTIEKGPIGGRETIRIIYPGDRITDISTDQYTGWRTELRIRDDGTFGDWLHQERGVDSIAQLDRAHFDEALSAFFGHLGWGTLAVHPLGGGFLAIDASNWAEAEPGSGEWPTCHFSTGMIPAFLGEVSGHALAALETDCRSRGDAECRFVVGAPDNLKVLYERVTGGMSLEDAVRG